MPGVSARLASGLRPLEDPQQVRPVCCGSEQEPTVIRWWCCPGEEGTEWKSSGWRGKWRASRAPTSVLRNAHVSMRTRVTASDSWANDSAHYRSWAIKNNLRMWHSQWVKIRVHLEEKFHQNREILMLHFLYEHQQHNLCPPFIANKIHAICELKLKYLVG